jgi:hypothetical protein
MPSGCRWRPGSLNRRALIRRPSATSTGCGRPHNEKAVAVGIEHYTGGIEFSGVERTPDIRNRQTDAPGHALVSNRPGKNLRV